VTIIAISRPPARRLRLAVLCCALVLAFFAQGIATQIAAAASPTPVARFTCSASAPGATLVCSPCPVSCGSATTGFALTGRAVVLDGRESSDDRGTPGTPNGTIVGYQWKAGSTSIGSGVQINQVFDLGGTYDISLTVTDNDGGGDIKHRTIAVNAPPVARFTRTPDGVLEPGEPVTFDGTVSTDAGGTTAAKTGLASYAWTFPGSATITTPKPTRTFTEPGTYVVKLAVTDKDGTADAHEESLRVNAPPTGAFTVSTQGAAAEPDEAVTFDASTSTDPDGEIARYAWDFGDGMAATGATVAHPFTTPGLHAVTLTVTDSDGKSATSTQTVRVNERPAASFTFNAAQTGEPVTFDARASRDPDGTVLTYRWEFGDGATAEGDQPAHAFAQAGRYTVALTVADADGATAGVSAAVEIAAPPPPPVPPNADSDRDGVADRADACASSPGDLSNGCPSRLKVDIRGRWRVNRLFSKLMTLYVKAPKGSRITVRCRSARNACPFKTRIVNRTTRPTTGLTRWFKKARILPAGTIITVRVTRAGRVGSYERLTLRTGRRLPLVANGCISSTSTRAYRCTADG